MSASLPQFESGSSRLWAVANIAAMFGHGDIARGASAWAQRRERTLNPFKPTPKNWRHRERDERRFEKLRSITHAITPLSFL